MESWTMIGRGNDSTVYLPEHKQHVVKVYDGSIGGFGVKDSLELLNRYSHDTLKAQDLINNKFHRKGFSFGGRDYNLKISILPQGETKLMSLQNVDELPRFGLKEYVVAFGQSYIEGSNFAKIVDDYNHNIGDSVFHTSINSFESSMKGSINDVQELLQKDLGLDLIIGNANVKPIFDKNKELVNLVITDLADSLLVLYRS